MNIKSKPWNRLRRGERNKKMGKGGAEQLSRALSEYLNTIHDTFQALDQTPASSLDKVSWTTVIKTGEQLSKHATTVGMLWTGETPEVKALEENMSEYFNLLQGFLLLSHGSKVGAGPTLSSCIDTSMKQVVDCSFMLMKEAVSCYGSPKKGQSIPQLVGTVWDACAALKKTPATNITAIGRAMTQVAVSIKDVIREMKELKPASSDPADEASVESSIKASSDPLDSDNSLAGDLGNDLTPEEMKVVGLAIDVVSEAVTVVKELIRSITCLLKMENSDDNNSFVNTLETLLKLCQGIGLQIDELGACLYPPHEVPALKAATEKISSIIDEMEGELGNLKGFSEAFLQACNGLRSSLRQLDSGLNFFGRVDIESKMENLVVGD